MLLASLRNWHARGGGWLAETISRVLTEQLGVLHVATQGVHALFAVAHKRLPTSTSHRGRDKVAGLHGAPVWRVRPASRRMSTITSRSSKLVVFFDLNGVES
jgi:hypothetical protein